jgi:RNA polymerase sigma-70 factor (ECF subfamily)
MYETEIINNILKGNRYDYGLLIKKYQANVFRTAIGFVHNKEDAEEITQDVFVKAYQSLSSFGGKAAFSTWLYRITVNTSLNFIRKKKKSGFWLGLSSLFQAPSKDKPAATIIEENAEKVVIREAIENLPEKQRLAFVLAKYEELPQKQVAAIMKISEGAVEQLIIRAKNNLRNKLEMEFKKP